MNKQILLVLVFSIIIWYLIIFSKVKKQNKSMMWFEPQYVIPFYFKYIKLL